MGLIIAHKMMILSSEERESWKMANNPCGKMKKHIIDKN